MKKETNKKRSTSKKSLMYGTKPAVATPAQVAAMEAQLHKLCDFHVPRIPAMGTKRLYCFLWKRLMSLDLERGLVPGQVPHRVYKHTPEFRAWESSVFDAVLARQEIVGDEWPEGDSHAK